MQKNTTFNKKTAQLFKKKQNLRGSIFRGERIVSKKRSKSTVFVNSDS